MAAKGTKRTKLADYSFPTRLPAYPALGRPVSFHSSRPFGWWKIYLLLVFEGLAIFLPVFYSVWQAGNTYTKYGPVPAIYWNFPWFLTVVAAICCCLALLIYRFMFARRFVAIHKNGLRMRIGWLSIQSWKWNELAGIANAIVQEHFLHLPFRTYQMVTLFLRNGKLIRLPGGLQDMPGLVATIEANLFPDIKSEVHRVYKEGEWLTFGPVAIQRSRGLSIQQGYQKHAGNLSTIFTWDEIDHITIENGHLIIELKDHMQRQIPVSEIPNLQILIELIEQGA